MDKWLSHPTALKIISLAIGILMWAVVHFDSERSPNSVASLTESKEIDAVQVRAVGLDEDNFALRGIDPGSVRLTVRASRSMLLQMTPDDFQVTVDVSTTSEGSRVLPVSVSKPIGIEIIDVQPRNVTVDLERMVTKEFEMQVKTEGTPDHDYKIGAPVVKPNNRVHVTLPADLMDQVGFVGGSVSVDGEEETVNEKKVKVTVLDKDGKEIPEAIVNPSVVEVEVPITKPFKNLPLQIGFTGKLPDGLAIASFKPSVEQVTVYGPQDVLDKFDYYDGVTVNLSKLTQSGTLTVDVPTEKGIATVDPAAVTIDYTIVPVQTKLLTGLRATIIGLSDGLNAKTTVPEGGLIDLAISGASSVLAGVGAKDVQLIADLSGLGPGSHEVPLDIHLPTFVGQVTPSPLNITVEITDGTATPPPGEEGAPGEGGEGTDGGQNEGAGAGGDAVGEAGSDAGGPGSGESEETPGADGEADANNGTANGGGSTTIEPPLANGDDGSAGGDAQNGGSAEDSAAGGSSGEGDSAESGVSGSADDGSTGNGGGGSGSDDDSASAGGAGGG